MATSHGTLENEIMNAIWTIEEKISDNDNLDIAVSDVATYINSYSSQKAYTTIKTVMDRLVEKSFLERVKIGKKFYYNSTCSRHERARTAIKSLAVQYFNNDINSLMKALEKECSKN